MKHIIYIVAGIGSLVVVGALLTLVVASKNIVVNKKLTITTLGVFATGTAQRENSLKKGFAKYVIQLLPVSNEKDLILHLIIGKNVKVDHCNTNSFVGNVVQKSDQTDGSYLELEVEPGMLTTTVECGPVDQEKFVMVEGEGLIQPYSSQNPLVLYVPEGFEVRYTLEKNK